MQLCELWESLKHIPHLHFSHFEEDSMETPELDALREQRGRYSQQLPSLAASDVEKKKHTLG